MFHLATKTSIWLTLLTKKANRTVEIIVKKIVSKIISLIPNSTVTSKIIRK